MTLPFSLPCYSLTNSIFLTPPLPPTHVWCRPQRNSLSLHHSNQHTPHSHHQHRRHSIHKQQHESTHVHHSGGVSRSAAKSVRHGSRPRPVSVSEISGVSSPERGFSRPLQENGGGGGSSGGSSSDAGWFFKRMSLPPTAHAILHGVHQRGQHNTSSSSSSVFHFPSSSAFPEGSAMSPVSSGNTGSSGVTPTTTSSAQQQQKSPQASPDNVVMPVAPVVTSGTTPTSGPAEVQTAAPQQQQDTPTIGRHSISPNRNTPEPEIRTRRSSESEVSSPPRGNFRAFPFIPCSTWMISSCQLVGMFFFCFLSVRLGEG